MINYVNDLFDPLPGNLAVIRAARDAERRDEADALMAELRERAERRLAVKRAKTWPRSVCGVQGRPEARIL